MAARVYVETSVLSYLSARPTSDVVRVAHQRLTRLWWARHRARFDLFASELVAAEAAVGDPVAARRRVRHLRQLALLPVTDDAEALARRLVAGGAVPRGSEADALHVAIATVNGMGFLVTWNCRHIANAQMRSRIERTCAAAGWLPRFFARLRSSWETDVVYRDPIVEEVRAARRKLLREAGGDLGSLVAWLRARETREKRRIVRLRPRSVKKPGRRAS